MSYYDGFTPTYTFSLCIERSDRVLVDTTVEVKATAEEIAKAKKTIQRLMNEYAPAAKAPPPQMTRWSRRWRARLPLARRNRRERPILPRRKSRMAPGGCSTSTAKSVGALSRLSCGSIRRRWTVSAVTRLTSLPRLPSLHTPALIANRPGGGRQTRKTRTSRFGASAAGMSICAGYPNRESTRTEEGTA